MTLGILPTPLQLPEVARLGQSDPAAAAWYAPAGRGAGAATSWSTSVEQARSGVATDWLEALMPALAPGGAALERIRRASSTGVVVTTGQQPGLFGGPLYTWHKALTALALADEIERRTGVPTAPVFWAATDDSDLAEATITTVAVPGGFESITIERSVERDTPMAAVPVGDVSTALDRLIAACGSASNAAVLELVRGAYDSKRSLGEAYVTLLRGVLEPLGVSVLDAAHPATRMAGAGITRTALERANTIASRLRERTEAMAAHGLRPQVRHVPGRTLVFSVNGDRRQRVRMSEAVETAQRTRPGDLSPNVLLRPIVERCILPTVTYVGGPAEIAYFAQVSAVAEALDVAPPRIVPRWSGFVVEPHVQRALDELELDVGELRDPHAALSRLAGEELPAPVRDALDEARMHARELAPHIAEAARRTDLPISDAAVEGAVRQLEHKLDRLHRRLIAAVKRRGSVRLQLLATARGALFARELPQERSLNVVPLLAKYGDEPLKGVLGAAREYVAGL